MEYKYFPNDTDELNYVMNIYEQEINNRRDWINESVKRLNEALDNATSFTAIHYAMTIVNHAMVVVRILDLDAISSRKRDKNRSKERAKILHERHSNLPNPPSALRSLRNNYEHFEEKLDEWATTSTSRIYVDLNVNLRDRLMIPGMSEGDVFRQLEDTELTFWNEKVNLQEVITWVGKINTIIQENNELRA